MKKECFIVPLLFASFFTTAQEFSTDAVLDQMKQDVIYLADDKLEGRATGSPGAKMAADHMIERFSEIGVKPSGIKGYRQPFSRRMDSDPHGHSQSTDTTTLHANNVIGIIDNGAENTVVIGAHYDHLGWGLPGSMHTGERAIHNGADDNASGVAMMIELARWVGEKELKGNNYLFIAFSGEELGLWGSTFFMNEPTIAKNTINFMINLDMVGRLNNERTLAVNGSGTSPIWSQSVENANKDSLKIVFSESGVGPSDHTQFYLKDIPVLHFFTGQHDDYHRPGDDVEKVNFRGMVLVSDLIKRLLLELDDDGRIEFTKTKDEDSRKAPKYSVTLGVMPDYLFDGKGMRISGVKSDRPAEKAGIIAGDIVVKMGEIDVVDMMSYMKGLGAFKKGETAKVTILRDSKRMEMEVTF